MTRHLWSSMCAVVLIGLLGACGTEQTQKEQQTLAGQATAVSNADALVVAAVTPATRMEFEGFIHFCGGGPPEIFRVTPGGTVHVRGAANFNEWVTHNSFVDGPETNVASVNINPKGGNVHLDVTLSPNAFDGTWEITQTLMIGEDGSVFGHGVGHGTGELHGMIIKFTTGPEVVVENPCSDLPSAAVSGVIISPA